MPTNAPAFTELLHAAGEGDRTALDALFARVYGELHQLAHRVRGRGGAAQQTLNTTALVHEAYLKLVPSSFQDWQGREHFFRLAARAMRQVLLNAAKARRTQKRGGGDLAVTLEDGAHAAPVRPAELIALDEALQRLTVLDPRSAEIVELRYFAGLSVEETAAVLRVSTPTVKRSWRTARAWLLQEIQAS
ncbi:MAG: sigma-70 family RNA polymerase sigma factor [Gemmatimonadetes bacterium]|jgi:RNA polymerase sigma factor (TIGR02999 family)|nr:sigma-70 family RNA polymerase sigma factor [Gemmatimonadota bacterium]